MAVNIFKKEDQAEGNFNNGEILEKKPKILMNVSTKMARFRDWLSSANLDTKDYQVTGMEWVLNRELIPTIGPPGGFLCDEMGLGKTHDHHHG